MAKCTHPHLGDSEEGRNRAIEGVLIPSYLDAAPKASGFIDTPCRNSASVPDLEFSNSDLQSPCQVADRCSAVVDGRRSSGTPKIHLPGRSDLGAVLELWKLGGSIVLLREDAPKKPARKWRKRRAPASVVESHRGGFGMRLVIHVNRRWEDVCVVDVDATDRSELETHAAIERIVGGAAAAWIPSGERGWHGVFAAVPGAVHSYKFKIDGITGEVLSGPGAYVCLWDPRRMIPAVHAIRARRVVVTDPEWFPGRKAPSRSRGPATAPDIPDGLNISADLFRGAVGPVRTIGLRWPVLVHEDGRILVGHRGNDLFDQSRAYAYPLAVKCRNLLELRGRVLDYAYARTAQMHVEELPADDVTDTAQSISQWTWKRRKQFASWQPGHRDGDVPREWQVWRGERSGKIRRATSAPQTERILMLSADRKSQREIAKIETLSKSGVQYILNREKMLRGGR